MDATFFVKGDKDLDKVMEKVQELDIDWSYFTLVKSSSNYPALQESISGVYGLANKLFAGALIFAGLVVSLLLFLWINARKKEIAVLLSIGISKGKIFLQFASELIFISIPAFVCSYFAASYLGKEMGNSILKKVTGDVSKRLAGESSGTQLGGGAEVDGFNKTLTSLDIEVGMKIFIHVVIFMVVILAISLLISSFNILRKKPKDLLTDIK